MPMPMNESRKVEFAQVNPTKAIEALQQVMADYKQQGFFLDSVMIMPQRFTTSTAKKAAPNAYTVSAVFERITR